MAIKKSELYTSLWKSCDELRGRMDVRSNVKWGRTKLILGYLKIKVKICIGFAVKAQFSH